MMVYSSGNTYPETGNQPSTGENLIPEILKDSSGRIVTELTVYTEGPAEILINGDARKSKPDEMHVCSFRARTDAGVRELIVQPGVSFRIIYSTKAERK